MLPSGVLYIVDEMTKISLRKRLEMINGKYNQVVKHIHIHQQEHYRFVLSIVKNKEDAMDIYQDSMIKALRKYKSIKDMDKLKSWFYQILRNTSYDYIRARKRESTIYIGDYLPEEGTLDHYEDIELTKALKALNPVDYEVIQMKYIQELKFREIADILEISENTVKSRVYSALKKLKDMLSDESMEV